MINLKIKQINQKLERFCKKGVHAFKSNEDILEIALSIFKLQCRENFEVSKFSIITKASKTLHACINETSNTVSLISVFKSYKLNRIEKEILLVVILYNFGMFECRHQHFDFQMIQKHINNNSFSKSVRIKKALSENGRLLKSQILISEDDPDDLSLSDSIVSMIYDKSKIFKSGWDIKTYKELLDRIFDFIKLAKKRSSAIDDCYRNPDQSNKSIIGIIQFLHLMRNMKGYVFYPCIL